MPVTRSGSGVPAGTIAHFGMATAPAGWLKANGAAVSRTTYAALFLAVGVTYGAGDGSTTFNLPDLRGEFVRGWDDGRGVDTGRAIGTAQTQDVQSHNHASFGTFSGNGYGAGGNAQAIGGGVTGSTGGTETRPRNVAALACIKF